MLTNAMRVALTEELAITRAAWPSLPEGPALVTAYAEAIDGYNAEEIHAGFRLARLDAGQFHPKPKQVRDACAAAAKRLRLTHGVMNVLPVSDSYCGACGSMDLWERPPRHRLEVVHAAGCGLRRPDQWRHLEAGVQVIHTTPEDHVERAPRKGVWEWIRRILAGMGRAFAPDQEQAA